MVEKPITRLVYIDNIRLVMILLVVMVHANVTYSGMGSWYYVEHRSAGIASFAVMGMFGSFTQAFFMGILFFLAGFFVPSAYDRKGFSCFMKDRLFRLGIPVLIYCIMIHPFAVAVLLGKYYNITDPVRWTIDHFTSFSFIGSNGPLWFALALLVFTSIYSLLRVSGVARSLPVPVKIGNRGVIVFILLVATGSFLVRMVQPIGTNLLNMRLCFFTQYIVLFVLGISARRNDWLSTLSRQFGLRWFYAALSAGTAVWALLMIFGGPLDGNVSVVNGGLCWQSAVYALWESFFCAGICLGLLVIFRDFLNKQNRLTAILSDNSFAVYVFHAPVLIAVSLTFSGMQWPPLSKAFFAAALAASASFVFAFMIRMIPGMKKVF